MLVVGELDVPLSHFWRMSLVEVQLKIEGSVIRKEKDIFVPLRELIAKLHNVNVTKRADLVKPRKVMELNVDRIADFQRAKDLELEKVVAEDAIKKMIQKRNGHNAKGVISKN